MLEKAIGQSRLAVIDMGNDREITDARSVHEVLTAVPPIVLYRKPARRTRP